MNNCVAINVIADNKILNNNGVPILFYWDGKSNVIDELNFEFDVNTNIQSLFQTWYFLKEQTCK